MLGFDRFSVPSSAQPRACVQGKRLMRAMAIAKAQLRARGTLNVVRQQRRLFLSAMPLQPTHQPLAGVVEQLVVA